jgi:type I restriction enzyme S subunit
VKKADPSRAERPGVRRSSGAFERPPACEKLQRAGALQDAGASSLPPIWKWTRLKFVAGIGNGSTPDRNNAKYWCSEGFPWLNSSVVNVTEVSEASDYVSELALKECHLPVLDPLTVLVGLTGQGKTRGSATLLTVAATINQHLAFVAPTKEKSDARYLRWLLVSKYHPLREQSSDGGSTKGALTCEDLKELTIPLPPLPTQRAIAGYLDRETKRLDELVRAKEGLLELVAEKRRALITRAVTRGLNPKSPLRDSGIPWLGLIPAHWEVSRLRWLINGIEQGWSPQADLVEAEENQWGVIKLSAVKRGEFVANENKALPPNCEVPGHLELKRGDFLLTRANTPSLVGDVCVVGQTRSKLIFSDLILRLQLDTAKVLPDYLKLLLQCPAGRSQIEMDARGSSLSMVKISQEHVPNWLSPVPPLAEQRAIVAHIATETSKLDALRASAERTIRLLKERRSALISAAVTGKIAISE